MKVNHNVIITALLLVSLDVNAALSTSTQNTIKNYNTRVRETVISADVDVTSVMHNKKAIEEYFTKPGVKLSEEGTTSETIESRHEVTFTVQGDNFYMESRNFLGRKGAIKVVQQKRGDSSIFVETSQAGTVYSDDPEDALTVHDLNVILPDATVNEEILSLPETKESDDQIIITGKRTESVFKNDGDPCLLFKKSTNDGRIVWERSYSDHTVYKGVTLPQVVVEKIYARNGNLFSTATYRITYRDNATLDKRLQEPVTAPPGAAKQKPLLLR